MLNALLHSIDESLNRIPDAVNRDKDYVLAVLGAVRNLCKKIKFTKNNDTLNLGFDTGELITSYIKHNYGNLGEGGKNYMIIAEEFKKAIEAAFSTTCTVGDLIWNVTTGFFDFNFSRADNSPISVCSREYAKGGILVYLVVHKLVTRDPMEGW